MIIITIKCPSIVFTGLLPDFAFTGWNSLETLRELFLVFSLSALGLKYFTGRSNSWSVWWDYMGKLEGDLDATGHAGQFRITG
jgi:hypothetical protein